MCFLNILILIVHWRLIIKDLIKKYNIPFHHKTLTNLAWLKSSKNHVHLMVLFMDGWMDGR